MMEISITYYNYIHYSDSVIYAQINKLQATSQTSLVIIQHSARVTLVVPKTQASMRTLELIGQRIHLHASKHALQ